MIYLWLTVIAIGVTTFLYRASFIFFQDLLRLPGWLEVPLRFVPAAALTAIIVPELLVRNGAVAIQWQNERLLAGLVATAVALWSKSVTLTLVIGMAALYLFQYFLVGSLHG